MHGNISSMHGCADLKCSIVTPSKPGDLPGRILSQTVLLRRCDTASELEKDFLLEMGNGTKSRGRPRRRWLDEIRQATNLDLRRLITIARNRENWRE